MTDESVIEGEFIVRAELGLHARPAGRFVAQAARFQSDVEVGCGDEWVNGESVLSILSLAAAQGTLVRIRASGPDSEDAVRELGALIESEEQE